jgi:hypothetical protein
MRNKTLVNALLFSGLTLVLLSSCGKSLSREGAVTLLDSIAKNAASSSFVTPKEWTIEISEKGTVESGGITFEGSLSEADHYSFADAYYHTTVTIDGKIGPAITVACTIEEWVYVDMMSISGAKLYVLVDAISDGYTGQKDYSLTEFSAYANASKAFASDDSVRKEQTWSNDLSAVPLALKDVLNDLTNDTVKSESYSTNDELSLESSISYSKSGTDYTHKIIIKDGFLTSDAVSEASLTKTVAYSWGRYKNSKPDLSTFGDDNSSSVSRNDASL